MGIRELEEKMDFLSTEFCHLIEKSQHKEDKIRLFKLFYETLLTLNNLKINQLKYDKKVQKIIE
jgi:hypothetical protein